MFYALQNLDDADTVTEHTFDDVDEAFRNAELFTQLGYEVSVPTSIDGISYTFTVETVQ